MDNSQTPPSSIPKMIIPTSFSRIPKIEKDPIKNGVKVLVVLIILLIVGSLGYLLRDKIFPQVANDATASQTEGFSSNTVVNGDTCSRTICSNTDKSQCIALAGTTQESGACLLNPVQADSKAQGLYEILASNPLAVSAEAE